MQGKNRVNASTSGKLWESRYVVRQPPDIKTQYLPPIITQKQSSYAHNPSYTELELGRCANADRAGSVVAAHPHTCLRREKGDTRLPNTRPGEQDSGFWLWHCQAMIESSRTSRKHPESHRLHSALFRAPLPRKKGKHYFLAQLDPNNRKQ